MDVYEFMKRLGSEAELPEPCVGHRRAEHVAPTRTDRHRHLPYPAVVRWIQPCASTQDVDEQTRAIKGCNCMLEIPFVYH